MKKPFKNFLEQLSKTNATLDYFVDFDKIIVNTEKISLKLNQLNYLIGKQDLRDAIRKVFEENPNTFEVLEILIAVRAKDQKSVIDKTGQLLPLSQYSKNADKIYQFVEETGLKEIFINKNITNLVDYVFGIEVGLDTNARKNRGGKNMEKAIATIFEQNNIDFEEQVRQTRFSELTSLGEDVKMFDFLVKTNLKTYLIETNYYNIGGSKLNETARSYCNLAPKINKYDDFEFVWITDGKAWLTAKNKLEEAYNNIPLVYNLHSIKEFIEKIKRER